MAAWSATDVTFRCVKCRFMWRAEFASMPKALRDRIGKVTERHSTTPG
jgi:hypothetical protein